MVFLGDFGFFLGFDGWVWSNLGGILAILGQIWGSENGSKMGFLGWGRGVLRKWGFFGFSGV